jgi:hypothetical protein
VKWGLEAFLAAGVGGCLPALVESTHCDPLRLYCITLSLPALRSTAQHSTAQHTSQRNWACAFKAVRYTCSCCTAADLRPQLTSIWSTTCTTRPMCPVRDTWMYRWVYFQHRLAPGGEQHEGHSMPEVDDRKHAALPRPVTCMSAHLAEQACVVTLVCGGAGGAGGGRWRRRDRAEQPDHVPNPVRRARCASTGRWQAAPRCSSLQLQQSRPHACAQAALLPSLCHSMS